MKLKYEISLKVFIYIVMLLLCMSTILINNDLKTDPRAGCEDTSSVH